MGEFAYQSQEGKAQVQEMHGHVMFPCKIADNVHNCALMKHMVLELSDTMPSYSLKRVCNNDIINGLAHDKLYIARLEEIAKQHGDAGTEVPTLVRAGLKARYITNGLALGATQYVASAAGSG
jgi:hypothetical protein